MLRGKRLLGLVAVLIGLFHASSLAQTTAADTFRIIALPDTQFYAKEYPAIFNSQMNWIVNNAASKDIKLVLGLGDIVDAAGRPTQWENADAAYKILDGKVPYMAAIGNHDYDSSDPSQRSTYYFNRWFGPSRYSGHSWYRGNYPAGKNDNFYGVFNFNGHAYLVLVLELFPRSGALSWASSILQANPDKEAIIVTHAFIYDDNSRMGKCDSWNAERMGLPASQEADPMWTNFVRKHANIIMVLNGHVTTGDGVGRRSDLGDNGNLVNQMLSDYQSYAYGGNGYLRILTITPSLNRIDVATYSPYTGAYLTDGANQFTLKYHATGAAGNGGLAGHVRSLATCSPVSNVTVTVDGAAATTDSQGRFTIASLAPGTKNVTAKKAGWITATNSSVVQSGYSAYDKFFLAPAGQLAGSVLSSTGAGIAGASVTVTGGLLGVNRTYTTDSTGHFSTGSIASGDYDLSIAAQGYGSTTGTATVTQNQTAQVSLSLTSTADATCALPSSPGVNLCTPKANTTVGSPLGVLATSSSTVSITRMELWVDGVKQYSVAGNKLDTNVTPAAGTHRIAVTSKDSSGATWTKAVYVTVAP